MSLQLLQVSDQRDGAIPSGRPAGYIFDNVGLRSDCFATRSPIPDPTKVDTRKILRCARRFGGRIGADSGLGNFRLENVKGISAGQDMPTEVRFAGPFG